MCLAIPGKIISISDDQPLLRMGRVSFGGSIKRVTRLPPWQGEGASVTLIQVSLAYVPETQIDDYVIVHAGFTLSAINPEEAEQTLNYIEQLNTGKTISVSRPFTVSSSLLFILNLKKN